MEKASAARDQDAIEEVGVEVVVNRDDRALAEQRPRQQVDRDRRDRANDAIANR